MEETPALMARESNYQPLMLEKTQAKRSKNVCDLTSRIVILCLSSFYFGYCLTYLSTFTTSLHPSSTPTPEETTLYKVYGLNYLSESGMYGVLIGIVPVGAILGAFIAPFLMRVLSRKYFILTINICALIIEGVIQVPNLYVLLACRAFQGIFIGNFMAIVPIYINELAPKDIVGSFGVFTQLFVVLALVVSYALGLILLAAEAGPFVFYRIMVGFNIITLLTQTICLFIGFIPESPNSLISKNRFEEAREVIGMFTNQQYIEIVMHEKRLEVQVQQKSASNQNQKEMEMEKESKIKFSTKAFLLGFELPFMQQLTGINAIVTQAGNIVSASNPTYGTYTPLIINFVQLLATIGTVFVLTKFGRRPLTLFGNYGLALCDIALGVLFIFQNQSIASILIVVMLVIYMIIYGISLGPVVWLYVPEIIPAKIVPFATMMNWFGCSLCIIFMPIVINAAGNAYPVFFFLGGLTLVFAIINTTLMVETKDQTAQQIANKFNKLE